MRRGKPENTRRSEGQKPTKDSAVRLKPPIPYREAYDLAPIGYLMLAANGEIIAGNLAAAKLLRTEREHLVGEPLSSFMEASDAAMFDRHREEVFSKRERCAFELRLRSAAGQVFPAHLESITVGDAAGRAYCLCLLRDLSELRNAQEGLRSSESRTQTLLDTVVDAVVSSDEVGRIESFNRAAETLFGYEQEELIGQNVRVLMPEPHRGSHDDYIERYRKTGEPRIIGVGNREVAARRKDGSTFPIEFGICEWWDHGRRKFTAIIRDISERKEAERQLQENEEMFREIAERVEAVFYVRQEDRSISYVSPAYERVWGRPVEGVRANAEAWPHAVHPQDLDRVARAYESMLCGDAFDEEYRILQPSGRTRTIRDRGYPVFDDSGRLVRSIGVAHDITDERELATELQQAQKMEAIGAFASAVAHDFNNVLHAIIASAQAALGGSTSREQLRDHVFRIKDCAKRGSGLARQLLTFGRKEPPRTAPVRVDDALRSWADLFHRLVGPGIRLEIEPSAPDSAISADPVQFEQMTMNLVSNARDAMPKGGTLRIRTAEVKLDPNKFEHRSPKAEPGRYVRVAVEDTGHGMDQETRTRMFEPFFTTKGPGQGTGLGLSTVLATVKRMDGCIEVSTEPGVGTSVDMCFPSLPQEVTAIGEQTTAGAKIVLIEDNRVARLALKDLLEDLGYVVFAFGHPKDALEACRESPSLVDLLLTDVGLPSMSGDEVAKELRRQHPNLPLVFMSGRCERPPFDTAIYLQKPIEFDALAEAVRSALLGRTG